MGSGRSSRQASVYMQSIYCARACEPTRRTTRSRHATNTNLSQVFHLNQKLLGLLIRSIPRALLRATHRRFGPVGPLAGVHQLLLEFLALGHLGGKAVAELFLGGLAVVDAMREMGVFEGWGIGKGKRK